MVASTPGYDRSMTGGAPASLEDLRTCPKPVEEKTLPNEKDVKNEVDINADSVTSYGEAVGETVESSAKVLETADDIVTQVLAVEDDPSINPWTFRMFFLGMGQTINTASEFKLHTETDISTRHWSVCFWLRASGNLLLQTANNLCLSGFLDGHCICFGRRYGLPDTPSRAYWASPESGAVQCQRTRCDFAHGFSGFPVCTRYRGIGCSAAFLRWLSESRRRYLHYIVLSAHRLRHRWFAQGCHCAPDQDALADDSAY